MGSSYLIWWTEIFISNWDMTNLGYSIPQGIVDAINVTLIAHIIMRSRQQNMDKPGQLNAGKWKIS